MPVIDKKEFAKLCGKPVNKLWTPISRGKIVLLGDGKIDTNDPRNKAFLEKWAARTENVEVIESKPLQHPQEQSEGQSYTESERQLKYLDTIKRQKEIEKLDIEIQKKRGEVVPSELIKPVFLQHNQSIITEITNRCDEFIRIFSKKRTLTVNEVAEVRGEVVSWVNESMNKAILASIKSVENIILEHSEKKGVGEHG